MSSNTILAVLLLTFVVQYCVCQSLGHNDATILYDATCSFEEDCCGWEPCDNANRVWMREVAAECKEHGCYGPGFDLLGEQGAYMCAVAKNRSPEKLNETWLQSPQLVSPAGPHCFSFHYNMNGSQFATLDVYKKEKKTRLTLLWSIADVSCNGWCEQRISINASESYQIVFAASAPNKNISTFAIDETRFSPGLCAKQGTNPPTAPSVNTGNNVNCSFDSNTCGWNISLELSMQWLNENVSQCMSSRACLGPGFDSSAGRTGSYMYIASEPKLKKVEDITMSYNIGSSNTEQCFSFYYHMFGIHVGDLNVLVEVPSGEYLRWTRSGTDDNVWREARITILPWESKQRMIVFKATSLNLNLATIAIDNTQLTDGPCDPIEQGCDFENGFCNWTAGENWKIESINDLEKYNGPNTDHTLQNGLGKVAVFRPKSPHSRITPPDMSDILLSPPIKPHPMPSCVQFWYFIPKNGLSSISVSKWYKLNDTNLDKDQTVQDWSFLDSISGTQNSWTYAEVVLENPNSTFQFLVEGLTRQDYNEIVAIDDIQISNENCEPPDICTFSHGFCDWEQLPDPTTDVRWLRTNGGNDIRFKNVPGFDRIHSDSGFFLFIDANFFNSFSVATLRKYVFSMKYAQACFSMFYARTDDGGPGGSINVTTYNIFETKTLFQANMTTLKDEWKEIKFNIQGRVPYEILIQGAPGHVGDGYVAIDYIALKPGLCEPDVITTPSYKTTSENGHQFTKSSNVTTTAKTVHQVTTEESTKTTADQATSGHSTSPNVRTTTKTVHQVTTEESTKTTADQATSGHSTSPNVRTTTKTVHQVTTEESAKTTADQATTSGHSTSPNVKTTTKNVQQVTTEESTKTTADQATTSGHSTFSPSPESLTTSKVVTPSPSPSDVMFHCNDDKDTLILHLFRCDNFNDCPNGADEENCSFYCDAKQYFCGNSCISQEDLCSNIAQCVNGSDEADEFCQTSGKCPDSFCGDRCDCELTEDHGRLNFSCHPGYIGWRCKPEEKSTPTEPPTTHIVPTTRTPTKAPPDTMFDCEDKNHTRILNLLRCDGVQDCPNKADETNCSSTCGDTFYYCNVLSHKIQGGCILESNMCDQIVDCPGTDEAPEFCTDVCPQKLLCGERCTCKWVTPMAIGMVVYKCNPGYHGRRCMFEPPPPLKSTSDSTSAKVDELENHIVWIAIPMMSFFVVVIVIMGIMLYRRNYAWIRASDLIGPNSSLYARNSLTDAEDADLDGPADNHSVFVGGTNLLADDVHDEYLTTSDVHDEHLTTSDA